MPQRTSGKPAEPNDPRSPDAKLARIVTARAPRPRDLSIAGQIQGMVGALRAADTGLAAATRAWTTVIPPDLAPACRIEGLSRGVLRVRVSDASRRFELDRFLRNGGEARVIGASTVAISAVRLRT